MTDFFNNIVENQSYEPYADRVVLHSKCRCEYDFHKAEYVTPVIETISDNTEYRLDYIGRGSSAVVYKMRGTGAYDGWILKEYYPNYLTLPREHDGGGLIYKKLNNRDINKFYNSINLSEEILKRYKSLNVTMSVELYLFNTSLGMVLISPYAGGASLDRVWPKLRNVDYLSKIKNALSICIGMLEDLMVYSLDDYCDSFDKAREKHNDYYNDKKELKAIAVGDCKEGNYFFVNTKYEDIINSPDSHFLRCLDFDSCYYISDIISDIKRTIEGCLKSGGSIDYDDIYLDYKTFFNSTKEYYDEDHIKKVIYCIIDVALGKKTLSEDKMVEIVQTLDVCAIIKILYHLITNDYLSISNLDEHKTFLEIDSSASLSQYHIAFLLTQLFESCVEAQSIIANNEVNILSWHQVHSRICAIKEVIDNPASYYDNHYNISRYDKELLENGIETTEDLINYSLKKFQQIVHPGYIIESFFYE